MSETEGAFREQALPLVDRLANLVLEHTDDDPSNHTSKNFSDTCFEATIMLREFLECWDLRQLHQASRNSSKRRVSRIKRAVENVPVREIISQRIKVKLDKKSTWKRHFVALKNGEIHVKADHSSSPLVVSIRKINDFGPCDRDNHADFFVNCIGESYRFRAATIRQRWLWLHALKGEITSHAIEEFVHKQNCGFKLQLLGVLQKGTVHPAAEAKAVNDSEKQFLFVNYSTRTNCEFAETLRTVGVKGLITSELKWNAKQQPLRRMRSHRKRGSEQRKSLHIRRKSVAINLTKVTAPVEIPRARLSSERLGVTSSKWIVVMQFWSDDIDGERIAACRQKGSHFDEITFAPKDVAGLHLNGPKLEVTLSLSSESSKIVQVFRCETSKEFQQFAGAMRWFVYSEPLRLYYHRKLLSHLLACSFTKKKELSTRGSLWWLYAILNRNMIVGGEHERRNVGNRIGGPAIAIQSKLVMALRMTNDKIQCSRKYDLVRLKMLAHMLRDCTVGDAEAKEYQLGYLTKHKPENLDSCTCSKKMNCRIYLAKLLDHAGACDLLVDVYASTSKATPRNIEIARWALKIIYMVCEARSLPDCPGLSHREATLSMKLTSRGLPFSYYAMKFGTQKHFRKPVLDTLWNITVGNWSIDEHLEMDEQFNAEIRHPELLPFVLQLAKGKVAWLHDVLAKLAVLAQREENAIAVASNPAWQGCFINLFLKNDAMGSLDQEESIRITKLTTGIIATVIAQNVMCKEGTLLDDQVWQLIALMGRDLVWTQNHRRLLQLVLCASCSVVASKIKQYMNLHEVEDATQIWKRLSRLFAACIEVILLPAEFATDERNGLRFALNSQKEPVDVQYVVKLLKVGEAFIGQMRNVSSKKKTYKTRMTIMLSFLRWLEKALPRGAKIIPQREIEGFLRVRQRVSRAAAPLYKMFEDSNYVECENEIRAEVIDYISSFFSGGGPKKEGRHRRSESSANPGISRQDSSDSLLDSKLDTDDLSSSEEEYVPPPPVVKPVARVGDDDGDDFDDDIPDAPTAPNGKDAKVVEAGGGGRAVVTPSSASASPAPTPRKSSGVAADGGDSGALNSKAEPLNETLQNLVTRLRSKLEIFKQRDRRNSDKVRNLEHEVDLLRKEHMEAQIKIAELRQKNTRLAEEATSATKRLRLLSKSIGQGGKGAKVPPKRVGAQSGDDSSGDSDDGAAEDSGSVFDTGFWASGEKKDGGKGGEAEAALEEKTPESEPPVSPGTSRRSLAAFVSSASVASSQAGQDAKLCESSASVSKARSADSDSSDDDGEARRSSATESLFEESFWKQEDAEDEKKTGDADDDDDTPPAPKPPRKSSTIPSLGTIIEQERSSGAPSVPSTPLGKTPMRTADDSNSFIEAANRTLPKLPQAPPKRSRGGLPTISEKSSSEVPGPASTKPPRSTQPVRRRTDSNVVAISSQQLDTLLDRSKPKADLKRLVAMDKPPAARSAPERSVSLDEEPPMPPPADAPGGPEQKVAGHKRSNTVILEPAKPVPSIPEPGLNITQQCQDLLTLIGKSGLFAAALSVTMKDLMSLINQSGDLHDAKINIGILAGAGVKVKSWAQLEAALLGDTVRRFRQGVQTALRERVSGGKVSKTDMKTYLVMARKYRISACEAVIRFGTGTHPNATFAHVYWRSIKTFEQANLMMKKERTEGMQFLMKNSVFRVQVRVTNSDVSKLVASVVFSRKGLGMGMRLQDAVKRIVADRRSFDSFTALIAAVAELCA